MGKLFTFLSILFGDNTQLVNKVDYCELDVDHLSLEMKVEMAMGCSTVNGKNVYSDSKLKRIYNI
jgi:hypothetical protein